MSVLLTTSILLLILWPAYAVLLRYSDRYALNRILLLLGMVAVCALPFLSFESPAPAITQGLQGTIEYVEQTTAHSLEVVPEDRAVYIDNGGAESSGPAEQATLKVQTKTLIYLGGLGLMLVLLGARMLFLLTLHLRSRADDRAGYRLLHKGASSGQAFTFGSNVYFSQDVPQDPDFEHIITHERVHARQLHSVDILFAEFFLCLFWFHPAAWWLRTKIRANLEYLVDKAVVNQGADRRSYQLALVRQSAAAQGLALALPFSEPSLHTRIARMTGMPEYRVVGILAGVALVFWLGVAMVVVNGNASQSQAIVDLPGPVNADHPDLGEAIANSTQADVNGISSFALYLRRLPTPSEFAQIQQMLGVLDHTRLSIYQPCNAQEGAYALQLSHWLNAEAQLPFYLKEDEILDYHYVFKLKPNGALNLIPKTPHVTGGYFYPKAVSTVLDDSDSFTYRIRKKSEKINYVEIPRDQNGRPVRLVDFREGIANEEIVVFINGERIPLKSAPAVTVKRHGADSDEIIKVRLNGRPVPTWSQSYFANWKEVVAENGAPPQPANERLVCLLGMGDNRFGLSRNVRSGHTGSNRAWFERMTLPEDREIHYYLNNDRSTAAEVLDREFEYADIQVGYDRNDPNGKIIVQVIDDMNWFVTRIE